MQKKLEFAACKLQLPGKKIATGNAHMVVTILHRL
jgi:hypothetical protein